MGFQLIIATGIHEGQAFSFEQPEARIGRTDENDVVLDEPGVSRLHARVFEDRGHYYAEDLGSANGTKVNGDAISEPCELRDGDSVAVGLTVIAFALKKKAPVPSPSASPVANVESVETRLLDAPVFEAPAPVPPPAPKPPAVVEEPPTEAIALPAALQPPPARTKSYEDAVMADPADVLDVGEPIAPPDGDATEIDQRAFVPEPAPLAAPVAAARETVLPEPARAPEPEAPAATAEPEREIDPEFMDGPPTSPEMPAAGQRSSAEIRSLETRLLEAHVPEETDLEMDRVRTEPPPQGDAGDDLADEDGGPTTGVDLDTDPLGLRRSRVKLAARRDAKELPRRSAVAEAARRRRLASDSVAAQLRFAWEELSPRSKRLWGGSLSILALAFVALVVYLVVPEGPGKPVLGPEPLTLGRTMQHASFGLGPEVQYRRPDLKAFTFDFNSATRAVALLHYQAQDISPDEVSLALNGASLGSVPADTLDARDRQLELVLPSKLLRRNVKNEVTFDNLHNPPGKDTWRIWNLWVEVIPVPELPKDQLLASAQDYFQKGKGYLEQRDVGSDNLFKAWKDFRIAWLMLESLDQRPEMYALVRLKLAESSRELDLLCGRMMLAAQKSLELKNRVKAKQRLEEISSYFPTTEHRCHNLAVEKLQDNF